MEDEELLNLQFGCCRSLVSSSQTFPASISSVQWIRLQALDLQATCGPCTSSNLNSLESTNRALWRSWMQLGSMCKSEAQEEFVKQVLQHCEALEGVPDVVKFVSELSSLSERREMREEGDAGLLREERALPASNATLPRASDLKTTLGALTEELEVLSSYATEDMRHMALAIQADVTIEERTMEARDVRAHVEDLRTEVQQLIKQLDLDFDAALARRKWSYEQIESQCEELLARTETCANTYKNQLSLAPSSSSLRLQWQTLAPALVLAATAAGAIYGSWRWWRSFKLKMGRLPMR